MWSWRLGLGLGRGRRLERWPELMGLMIMSAMGAECINILFRYEAHVRITSICLV